MIRKFSRYIMYFSNVKKILFLVRIDKRMDEMKLQNVLTKRISKPKIINKDKTANMFDTSHV